MKLYALTTIKADDKDQTKCGAGCQYLEVGECQAFRTSNGCPRKLRRNNMAEYFRCPACLHSTEINTLVEDILIGSEEQFSQAWEKTYQKWPDVTALLAAILGLKGKLK